MRHDAATVWDEPSGAAVPVMIGGLFVSYAAALAVSWKHHLVGSRWFFAIAGAPLTVWLAVDAPVVVTIVLIAFNAATVVHFWGREPEDAPLD